MYINCCPCSRLCEDMYMCVDYYPYHFITLVSAAIVLKLILMQHLTILVLVTPKYTIHILILL